MNITKKMNGSTLEIALERKAWSWTAASWTISLRPGCACCFPPTGS